MGKKRPTPTASPPSAARVSVPVRSTPSSTSSSVRKMRGFDRYYERSEVAVSGLRATAFPLRPSPPFRNAIALAIVLQLWNQGLHVHALLSLRSRRRHVSPRLRLRRGRRHVVYPHRSRRGLTPGMRRRHIRRHSRRGGRSRLHGDDRGRRPGRPVRRRNASRAAGGQFLLGLRQRGRLRDHHL